MAVPAIFSNFGSPSYLTSSLASLRLMAAVCGIRASSNASSASGVPATETRTPPISDAGGMSLKATGSLSALTNVHGPLWDAARNQRPESNTYMSLPVCSLSHGVSVLDTYSNFPSGSAFQLGLPSVTISSVGSVATTIAGIFFGTGSLFLEGGNSLTKSAGGEIVSVHGPSGSFASYQTVPPLRYNNCVFLFRTTANGVFRTRS